MGGGRAEASISYSIPGWGAGGNKAAGRGGAGEVCEIVRARARGIVARSAIELLRAVLLRRWRRCVGVGVVGMSIHVSAVVPMVCAVNMVRVVIRAILLMLVVQIGILLVGGKGTSTVVSSGLVIHKIFINKGDGVPVRLATDTQSRCACGLPAAVGGQLVDACLLVDAVEDMFVCARRGGMRSGSGGGINMGGWRAGDAG